MVIAAVATRFALFRNRCWDGRMRVIPDDVEVLELVVEDRIGPSFEYEFGEWTGLTTQLKLRLLEMIRVKVHITERDDNLTDSEIALLGNHVREKGQGALVVG